MIQIVDGKPYLKQVKELIIEYTNWLGRDLSFQDLDQELSHIDDKYTPPNGELLVAIDENQKVLGMIAYHQHTHQRCEMKRLYIRPEGRGQALGDRLITQIMAHAKASGYTEMVLDTIKPLQAAIHLYNKHGFKECEPYYHNPMDDVIYMKRSL